MRGDRLVKQEICEALKRVVFYGRFGVCVKSVTNRQGVCPPTANASFMPGKAQIMSSNQLFVFKFEEATPIRTVTVDNVT